MPKSCAKCLTKLGITDRRKCSLCKEVRYCSERCQQAHWNDGHCTACPARQSNQSDVPLFTSDFGSELDMMDVTSTALSSSASDVQAVYNTSDAPVDTKARKRKTPEDDSKESSKTAYITLVRGNDVERHVFLEALQHWGLEHGKNTYGDLLQLLQDSVFQGAGGDLDSPTRNIRAVKLVLNGTTVVSNDMLETPISGDLKGVMAMPEPA